MKAIFRIAWDRLNLIALIMGDVQSRVIMTTIYFTILVPFGIGSRLFSDPLHMKQASPRWHERPPVPTDLDSARDQG